VKQARLFKKGSPSPCILHFSRNEGGGQRSEEGSYPSSLKVWGIHLLSVFPIHENPLSSTKTPRSALIPLPEKRGDPPWVGEGGGRSLKNIRKGSALCRTGGSHGLTVSGKRTFSDVGFGGKGDSGISPSAHTFSCYQGRAEPHVVHPGSFQPRIPLSGRIATGLFRGVLGAFFRGTPF
jgi:hypothetical protein